MAAGDGSDRLNQASQQNKLNLAGAERTAVAMRASRLAKLEQLVDELIKERPKEEQVQFFMEAAGLSYVLDPVDRMNQVLSALNHVRDSVKENGRGKIKVKGGEHGQNI